MNPTQQQATSDEPQAASVQLLRMFAPLDSMKRENLTALVRKVSVRTLSAGRALFSQGDKDKRTLWLVSGALEVNGHARSEERAGSAHSTPADHARGR